MHLVCTSNFHFIVLLYIVSHITLIMPGNSISGISSNSGPLPDTTKNLHLAQLPLSAFETGACPLTMAIKKACQEAYAAYPSG